MRSRRYELRPDQAGSAGTSKSVMAAVPGLPSPKLFAAGAGLVDFMVRQIEEFPD